MMILYPAIDILDGTCVRLSQGSYAQSTLYFKNPLDAAQKWVDEGAAWIHVVDLNGAKEGKPVNLRLIETLIQKINIPIQLGGGIRTLEMAGTYLKMGISRIILGSAAAKNPELARSIAEQFPGQVAVGLDAKNNQVAIQGWEELATHSVFDLAKEFDGVPLAALIYTDIQKDGMLSGPNLENTAALVKKTSIPVIASGGIASLEDLTKLKGINVKGAILGRALYEETFQFKDALKRC